ncbi:sensor domain-containing diguanylate cyclase [Falsigemmobacter intermedius]|uniref:diguanylate cyclase n=1 Tax=Falsigemmobacter intermedius TaxID=1553448 RepID=A0A3S3UQT3_9RHOB|nr:sensor domain-containing diguanylate cyclase [Falsigemmobacter intermedius]RWY38855.1 sensor domain-containing diguanylate cyclase [Falsigemmobacter intermedius]
MQIRKFKADDEQGRLAAVQRFEVLDTDPEKEFQDIVSLVKSIFNVPRAAINILDSERQWTKAGAGDGPNIAVRTDTFCHYTIMSDAPLVVTDASIDNRFAQNPYVLGAPELRAYLGVPLTSEDGYNIGSLCIYDTCRRDFSDTEVDVLSNFARVVMSQLELRLTSRMDPLTGLLTWRAFSDLLERHRSLCNPAAATLILLDIDHFKSVNDRYGHLAGNEVLKTVTAKMSTLIRKSDAFGRLGGEEFGVLMHGATPEGAFHLTRRIQEALADLALPAIGGAKITVSMGLAGFTPGESREDWLERADRALYQAKAEGRNRAVLAQLTL